jgi:rhamnulokinase
MSNLYVACELGAEKGRIWLGALQKEGLLVSEAAELKDLTKTQEGSLQWDVPTIYQQLVAAVRGIVAQEEPVRAISFHSAVNDSLLFEGNGSVIEPVRRITETEARAELNKLQARLSREALYEETGVQPNPSGLLCHLVAESPRRLKKASHALSLPDGFNYLFSGVPRFERSQASQTQLYNPSSKSWSDRLLQAAGINPKLLPPVIPAGTQLAQVRPEIAREAGLDEAKVVAACAHELAASLAALNIADPGSWAFLWPDHRSVLGTRLTEPFINELSREMKYSNHTGYEESVGFCKQWEGLRLVEECRQAWAQQDRALDQDVLLHLATSAPPFEALIDPADARFAEATDMPQAIQAFCRETGQEIPRKPGPILRCVLESLALHYRKGLLELEYVTGTTLRRLYVLGGKSNLLLNHFLANALQIPVVVVPPEAAAVGNVAIQALTLSHITSADQARELVRHALPFHSINPHARAWTEAFDRFLGLAPA